jgi:hypothetical protein
MKAMCGCCGPPFMNYNTGAVKRRKLIDWPDNCCSGKLRNVHLLTIVDATRESFLQFVFVVAASWNCYD